MAPKVSVIVPVYNVENYLRKCLDTLVNQTLKEIEILVINDGSPDNSQEIIDEYAAKYPQTVRSFIKENGGLSDARNYGIERATGEYLAFIDSDDYVDIDMFEKMYEKAVETGADVVNSPYSDVFKTTVKRKYYGNSMQYFGKSVQESPRILRFANSFAWNKIYRREFWLEHNFKFPVGQWFEDSALIYNVMGAANKVECVNIAFYYYVRSREDSITNTIDERIFDIFKSVDSLVGYYQQFFPNEELEKEITYLCLRHTLARAFKFTKYNDKETARRFLRQCYAFYDEHLPNWKECTFVKATAKSKRRTRIVRFMRRHPKIAELYYIDTDAKMFGFLKKLYKFFFGKKKKPSIIDPAALARKEEKTKEKKRAQIQKNGLDLMELVQKLLKEIGVICFADFGTMLGLIREGKLLAHDLDVDMGVIINEKADLDRIRVCLDRYGILLWRQYFYEDNIVEESYHYCGVKIDLNYYRITDEKSNTWLFYRDPEKEYPTNTRNIVEMTYSPIKEFKNIDVMGRDICIPANAEQLLVEKYGENWRIPDTDWIYWLSPAATRLPDIGYYVTHRHRRTTVVNEEWFEKVKAQENAIVRKEQKLQLKALKAIADICAENGITYYLGENTLRFANFYGKLVPWDFDLFLLMPKKDYDKFLAVAKTALPKDFVLQHSSVTENYWSPNMAVRCVDNSEFYQTNLEGITEFNGPVVQILPLCPVPEFSSDAQVKQRKKLLVNKKYLNYKSGLTKPSTVSNCFKAIRSRFISFNKIHANIEKLYNMFENEECAYYVNLASYYNRTKSTNPIEYFGEPKYIDFEGMKMPVPTETDEVLYKLYGFKYNESFPWKNRVIKKTMTYRGEE